MPLTTYRNIVIIAYLAGTCVAYGQRISYGVEGGVTTLDPIQQQPDESKRYVVGGTIEVALWRGLAVEADLIYRHNKFNEAFYFFNGTNNEVTPSQFLNRATTDVFELPVLGKYYFRRDSKLQPFVSTGYAFRKAHSDVDSIYPTANGTMRSRSSFWTPLDIGAAFGAGVRWRVGIISLRPEFRYTYWNSHPVAGVSKQQADVLLGITF